MISRLNYSFKYLHYWLFSKHKKGHGIHSPFVFSIVKNVFNNNSKNNELNRIFKITDQYKKNNLEIIYTDLGAGSSFSAIKKQTIGKSIKKSSVNKKYGKLLFNLIAYFKPKTILEIGTSLGISTAYIGSAAPDSEFKTIEGAEPKLKIAKEIAQILELENIRFIHGEFGDVLENTVSGFEKLDFVFFDGNHKKEPTLSYFNLCLEKAHRNSVFIFDDIHWSTEMEQAWEEIKQNKKVRVSIDIFRMGIVFFNDDLSFQHYVIKF